MTTCGVPSIELRIAIAVRSLISVDRRFVIRCQNQRLVCFSDAILWITNRLIQWSLISMRFTRLSELFKNILEVMNGSQIAIRVSVGLNMRQTSAERRLQWLFVSYFSTLETRQNYVRYSVLKPKTTSFTGIAISIPSRKMTRKASPLAPGMRPTMQVCAGLEQTLSSAQAFQTANQ